MGARRRAEARANETEAALRSAEAEAQVAATLLNQARQPPPGGHELVSDWRWCVLTVPRRACPPVRQANERLGKFLGDNQTTGAGLPLFLLPGHAKAGFVDAALTPPPALCCVCAQGRATAAGSP